MRKTVLLIAAVVIPIMLEAADIPEVTDRHWTRKYDQYFRKYSKRFFGPAIDWPGSRLRVLLNQDCAEMHAAGSMRRGSCS